MFSKNLTKNIHNIMKKKIFYNKNKEKMQFDNLNLSNNFVVVTIYDKVNKILIGSKGSFDGNNFEEKILNALNLIIKKDDRFNSNIDINKLTFQITLIQSDNFTEMNKKRITKNIKRIKKKKIYDYSLYVELYNKFTKKLLFNSYYIPNVIHEINNNSKILTYLIKKANIHNINMDQLYIKYYLLKSENFVDLDFIKIEKKANEKFRIIFGGFEKDLF